MTGSAAAGIARDLADLLFPRRCPGCGAPAPARGGAGELCGPCRGRIARPREGLCAGCGVAAAAPGEGTFCPACRGRHGRDAVVAGAAYAGVVRELVHAFKYRADFAAGRALGRVLVEAVRRSGEVPDLLVPVPLHPRRLRERGFNQAALLGRDLARALGVPLAPDALRRDRPTRPLAGLDRAGRGREVRGAFTVRRAAAVAGRRVLVVDDVLATGATAEACARALKGSGAAWAGAAVAARALPAPAAAVPAACD